MKKEIKKKNSTEDLAIIVNKGFSNVHKEIEDLAIMIGRGFEDVDKRFENVDRKFENLEEKLSRKIEGLSNRIDDLSLNRATREELKILSIRVDKVEKKVFSAQGGSSFGGK